MEDIEQKAIELIEKFEQLVVDIAPDALELGLFVAQIAAAQELAQILIWFVVVGICIFFTYKSFRLGKWDSIGDPENFWAVGMIVAPAAAIITSIVSLVLFSIWPFIGIFYPEVWIAKEVLGW